MKTELQQSRLHASAGLTIFELLWFTMIVVGTVAGAKLGFDYFGVWGVVVGIPVGAGVGFLAVFGSAFLLGCIFKALCGGTVIPTSTPSGGNTPNAKSRKA